MTTRLTSTKAFSVAAPTASDSNVDFSRSIPPVLAESYGAAPTLSTFWVRAIIAGFLSVDLFLLFSTVLVQQNPDLLFLSRFNLGVEHNIAVWWSTITLFLAALLFYSGQHQSTKNRIAGIMVAFVIAGLSLDELGSLHERVMQQAGWEGLAPLALIVGGMLFWALRQWLADPLARSSAFLLLLGFACFGSVVGQEYLEHKVSWPAWATGIRTGIEEGIELAGTLFCLISALRFHRPTV